MTATFMLALFLAGAWRGYAPRNYTTRKAATPRRPY